MATTEDTMSSDRAPPERPEAGEPESEIDAEREAATEPLSNINTTPGTRRTGNVEMLVIEADMVCNEDHEPDNPAIPVDAETGEAFFDRIEDTDLVPAWTRPWEGADE